MSNKFGIPMDIEIEIRHRDKKCVYCHREMKKYLHKIGVPGDKATIEHFNENGPFHWKDGLLKEDIAICCGSCNSSRGSRRIIEWFKKIYCLKRNINAQTVAEPVKEYLRRVKQVEK